MRTQRSATTRDLMVASKECLAAAAIAGGPNQKFALAHLSALRAAAAVLACQGRPSARGRPRSAWELLTSSAPELTEWAVFFAAGASKRSRAEVGLNVVSEREADDLYRDAVTFHELVGDWLQRNLQRTVGYQQLQVAR